MSRDPATVLDILQAARRISAFKGSMGTQEFLADEKTQSAVLHQLMVIGEAVKRPSAEFRTRHPQIPWSNVAGMRDVLIRWYDDVDLEGVAYCITGHSRAHQGP